jgi:hypothetical protein
MNFLYAIPAALLLILTLAIALLLAGVGQYLVHRRLFVALLSRTFLIAPIHF